MPDADVIPTHQPGRHGEIMSPVSFVIPAHNEQNYLAGTLNALKAAATALDTSVSRIQGVVGLYIAGFGLGQLPAGFMADRVGRRPVLFVGLAIFIAGGLVSGIATSSGALLASRFVQGLGGASAAVLARTIVRDVAQGAQAANTGGFVPASGGFVPASGETPQPILFAHTKGPMEQFPTHWRSGFHLGYNGGMDFIVKTGSTDHHSGAHQGQGFDNLFRIAEEGIGGTGQMQIQGPGPFIDMA